MENNSYIKVILPLKLDWEPYYKVTGADIVHPGDRVSVSFKNKEYIGTISEVDVQPDIEESRILPILKVENDLPAVMAEEMKLWRSVADYYMCSVGEIYKSAYPINKIRYEQHRKIKKAAAAKEKDEVKEICLSEAQDSAFKEIKTCFSNNKTVLLQGVTGSGKTEIYMKLADECLASGKNVLYLVPEIALSIQLEHRLEKHFGTRLSVYHSAKQAATKRDIADKIRKAEENYLVLGTRSSLFLPHNNLGLIIVDEEHDSSYKQDSPAPRYNGRDVAAMLAVQQDCRLILGSATPSLESLYNVYCKKYSLVKLSEKYYGNSESTVMIIDTKAEWKKRGMKGNFSIKLIEQIRKCLEHKGQVLILRSRKAYSSAVQCIECGEIMKCPHCNVPLSYHKDSGEMVCHCCSYRSVYNGKCPSCQSDRLMLLGAGTQKIEEEASALFPEARIERLDGDITRTEEKRIIRDFAAGNTDILIGTQIITKGFDFENISLVAVISADSLLGIQDFRADEKALQLLSQFRGRSGRRGDKGLFVIQTAQSSHPVYSSLDGETATNHLLEERRTFAYPPFSRIIIVNIIDRYEDRAQRMALQLSRIISQLFPSKNALQSAVTGPYSPVIDKISDEYLRCIRISLPKDNRLVSNKAKIKAAILAFEEENKYDGHITVNVDPS